MAERQVHQSIARAVEVLNVLGGAPTDSMRATDVAEAAGLGAPTASRLLATLQELGYVSRRSDREFSLGPRLLLLATQALNQTPVFREGRMLCQELAQATGLSANLGIREGACCIYVAHFEGHLAPKNQSMVGLSIPLHASALGKCLLLDTTEAHRRELLGEELHRYTTHTAQTHQDLTAHIETARECGYAEENEEFALGRRCIAAPVRDRSGEVCAAISVSGRASILRGLDMDGVIEQLVEVADRISVNLGHLGGASL